MAIDDLTGGKSPFDYAPEGMQQNANGGSAIKDLTGGTQPWLQVGAATGGQLGSTQNAFNDEFFDRMYTQYEQEQKKIEQDPDHVSDLFLRPDFTGIVGWNQNFSKDGYFQGNQALAQGDREFRVGDIYDNGQFIGNAYDKDSGFTLEEANAFIAPHIFGKDAADEYRKADGDQQKLQKLILDKGEQEGKMVEAYVTRAPYQKAVNDMLNDWEESGLDEVLIGLSGAAGGVAAGAAFGPWGMVGGAVLGGIGSLMNQDEARMQAAQSMVSTQMMGDVGTDAQAAHAIAQIGGLGMSRLNVFSNLAAGATDALWGQIGDNESELRRAAYEGNVGANIATGVTGFVDGLLQSSNGAAMLAYTGTLGASALGTAYNKAAHDGEWDEVTGDFHKYDSAAQRLAAAGASAIDISQMMLPALLRYSNSRGIGGTRSNGLDDMSVPGSTGRVTVMDRTFDVENQAGKIVATKESLGQSVVGWLAPSTIVSRLSTRASAYGSVIQRGGSSVSVDDLYQAAVRMERANIPWKLAMVNGFGEAGEEVLQTYLNGAAVGWNAEPQELLSAAIAGFSMGAGMSVGARIGTLANSERERFRANTMLLADGETALTRAEWKQLDPSSQRVLGTANKTARRMFNSQMKDFRQDMEQVVVQSTVGAGRREDLLKTWAKRSNVRLEGDSVENMTGILPFNSVSQPSYMVFSSGQTTLEKFQERLTGLNQELAERTAADPATTDQIRAIRDSLAGLLPQLQDRYQAADFEGMNSLLQNYWHGDAVQRRAVELVYSRMPNDNPGSFQMLLTQVSPEMEQEGAHGYTQISQSFEKLLSHDNDGDQLKHMARYVPNDAARAKLRLGQDHWAPTEGQAEALKNSGGFLNVAKREYEDAILVAARFTQAGFNRDERTELATAFNAMVDFLQEALGDAVRPSTFRDFRKALFADPDGAKKQFYRDLAKDFPKLMQLAQEGTRPDQAENLDVDQIIPPETSIGIWIEDKIQIFLEGWNDARALRTLVDFENAGRSGAQPPRLGAGAQSTREIQASTLGQTNEQQTSGSDTFRSAMGLQYNVANSVAEEADRRGAPGALREMLVQWYTNLTRMRPYTQIEVLKQGGNPVVRQARADLANLATAYFPELASTRDGLTEAMMRLARQPFWNIDAAQALTFDLEAHDLASTLGAVLIKNAAKEQSALTPTAFGELDASEAYANTTPGRAMVLLMGEAAPSRLLPPEQAAQLGAFSTLATRTRDYAMLPTRLQREEWRVKWELDPAYSEEDSLYRIFVDSIREGADTELVHGARSGPRAGEANGRLAKEDRKFQAKTVIPIFENMNHVVSALGLRKMTDRNQVIRALENSSQSLQQILDMFPIEVQLQILQTPSGSAIADEFAMPGWFFDMILEANPEKAAFIYWNALFEADRDARYDDALSGNAWVQMYKTLTPEEQDTFNELRASATSVMGFVNAVNLQVAHNRAPLMAWRTDTSLYDPSVTKSGWQWSSPSAERRQALRDANEYFVGRAGVMDENFDLAQRNMTFASSLEKAMTDPRFSTPTREASVTALKNRLAQSTVMRRPVMGPAGRRAYVNRAYQGLGPSEASKGVAGPAFAQYGDTDVRRDQTMFGSQLDQTFNALLTGDTRNIVFSPQMLMSALRLQTESGAIIDWTPPNELQFVQLMQAADGAYQNLLFALINPSIYEENGAGRAIQQYLFPQDLEHLLSTEFYTELINGDSKSRGQVENNEVFLSYVDSLTGNNLVSRMLADGAIARSSRPGASSTLSDSQYADLIADTADAIRALMQMPESASAELRTMVNDVALQDYARGTEVGEALQGGGPVARAKLDILVQQRKDLRDAALAEYSALPEGQKTVEATLKYLKAVEDYSIIQKLDTSRKFGELQLDALSFDWTDEASASVLKTGLTQYINQYLPEMQTTMTGDDIVLMNQWQMAEEYGFHKRFSANPAKDETGLTLDQRTWNHLARLVALHRTLKTGGFLTSSSLATPQSKEWAQYDPSFTYLVSDMISPEFLTILNGLRKAVPEAVPQDKDAAGALEVLRRTVLDRGNYGKWVPDLVMQHSGARRYLDASGAPQQVAIGGDLLKNHIAATLSAERTWASPTAEMAHPYSIPVQDLLNSEGQPFDRGLDGEPWALLNNASVVAGRYIEETKNYAEGGPALVVRDSQGQVIQSIPLFVALENIWGGKDSSIKSVTHDSLVTAAKATLERIGDQSADIRVEFQLFHPFEKPANAQWANNRYFDGSVGPADNAPSIYAAVLSDVDGMVQRLERAALDSIKGSLAIFTARHERGFDEKNPLDLKNLAHDITMQVMQTPMAENYLFPVESYRGVLRMVRDRLMVIGDQGEETVKLSFDQAVTADLTGFTNLRVVELSTRSLETLRGATGGSGHPRVLTRAPLIGGEADGPWTGAFAPTQLERLPRLGERITDWTDIAEALRSSGILDAERIQSFRYKPWTADGRALANRPFATFDARRSEIKQDRRETANERAVARANRTVAERLGSMLRESKRASAATSELLIGDIGGIPLDKELTIESAARNVQNLLTYAEQQNARLFIVNPRATESADAGFLQTVKHVSGQPHAQVSPVDDVVVLQLDGFSAGVGSAEWKNQVGEEIAAMKDRGLMIVLHHSSDPTASDMARNLLLDSAGEPYRTLNSELQIFAPDDRAEISRTEQARIAALTSTQRIGINGWAVTAYSEDGFYSTGAEGSFIDPRSTWTGTTAGFSADIVPTTGMARYHNPGTAEFGQRVTQMLKAMTDGTIDGAGYLADQAILGDKGVEGGFTQASYEELRTEFEGLLQKALLNTNPATGRPWVGRQMDPGDLAFTVNELGALTFTRWGYDASSVNFEAQDASGLDGIENEGVRSTRSIRVVASKKIRHDQASLRGGVVQEVFDHPVFGLQVLFKGDINLYGAKMVDQAGLKTRGVLLPENKRPRKGLLNNLFPAMYRDYDKKGLAQADAMLNARQAIFMMGWDGGRALANALSYTDGHPDPQATRWTIEEWDGLGEDGRAAVIGRVKNTLRLHRLRATDRVSDPRELAMSVFKTEKISDTARQLIEEEQGAALLTSQARAALSGVGMPTDDIAQEYLYLSAVLQYLKGDGTEIDSVFGAPGFEQSGDIENRESFRMPATLTQFIDQNLALRRYVQKDMNSRMTNNVYDQRNGQLLEGWFIKDDWRVVSKLQSGQSNTIVLRATRAEPTGEDHSERYIQNRELATHDNASNQQQMMAKANLGMDLGHGVRDPQLTKLLQADSYAEFQLSQVRPATPQTYRTSEEQNYRDDNVTKALGYLQLLKGGEGTSDDLTNVSKGYVRIYDKLGLTNDGSYKIVVDSMIRLYHRAGTDPKNPDAGNLSASATLEALRAIDAELKAYRWPTGIAGMPLMHADIVDLIAKNGTWTPDNAKIDGSRTEFLLRSALGNMYNSSVKVPAEARREVDALVSTYEKYLSAGYWEASAYPSVVNRLANPNGEGMVSSTNPNTQALLEDGDPYEDWDGIAPEVGNVSGGGTGLEASKRWRRTRNRTEGRGGFLPQTMAQGMAQGDKIRDKVTFTSELWRNAHAVRTIVPQLNPWLWVWNPIDQKWRQAPSAAAALVTGGGLGVLGRSLRTRVEYFANKIDTKLDSMTPEQRESSITGIFKTAFGVEKPWIDPEANALLPEALNTMLHNVAFQSHLVEETRNRPDDLLLTRGDRQRQRAVDFASRTQDLFRQKVTRGELQQYLWGVMEYERVNAPDVTAASILRHLMTDPSYYRKNRWEAHERGLRNVANTKGQKLTAAGALIDRALIPTANSSSLLSGPANALLFLAKFRNFALTSAVQMLGGQAVDSAAAILMQAIAFRKQAYREARGEVAVTPTDYLGKVLETSDFADMVIRSGLSMTGLFAASLGFAAAGFTGETEDERRKRRIEMLQGLGTLYDPRDVANSFLNERSVFMEGILNTPLAPLAGWLSAPFSVPNGEGQPARSPAELHWTLNFFVSPVQGMAEFLQTGDFNDLVDGFAGALGQMPLINTNFVWDAWTTAEKMYSNATDDEATTPGEGSAVMGNLIKAVATLEKITLELAFINEIASASDEVIRQPWAVAKTGETGDIIRNAEGLPEETDVKVEKIDDNPSSPTYGQVIEVTESQSYEEGLFRSYTQNQQTLAFLSTLVTGFQFGKSGSFMRGDMVAQDRTIQKQELSDEDAETLILSVWDPNNNQEVLTRDGAERLFDSLMAGTVKASDPALQNIYITYDQRVEISDTLQKKIFVEGVEKLGLSSEDATERMYDIWNGAGRATPLYDVIWSQGDFAGENGLPWNQTEKYIQLNTTWAQGPDGKFWATGVQRSLLPLQTYQGSSAGGIRGNLGVDEVLNSTDSVLNINTGYRSLTRQNNNTEIPSEEDIIKAIQDSTKRVVDEIGDLGSDLYKNQQQYGGGYRYGGGGYGSGGGGGGGYSRSVDMPFMPFLNGMRTPYADNIPTIYINNISPRRASVRRERFSSERGRLNNQQ